MNKERRSSISIALRLMSLVKPLMGIMILAIIMGTLGFLVAIFIPIFGAFAMSDIILLKPIIPLNVIFISVIVFAILRGILRYAEQAANHHIAFKLLAIIRDYVFKALRKLAPAKLETKDKGNLISMITTDIELIEVFYAHTISPVAIAILVSIIMTIFIGSYHPLFGLIALMGYITVGIIIPVFISRLGQHDGMIYRENIGNLSSHVLDSLRGLREVIQFNYGRQIQNNIEAQTRDLNKTLKNTKSYEGLTNALVSSAIMVFSLLILFVGLNFLYTGRISIGALLISFVAMISSFGPVVALANLSNNLIQTFAAADRILDLLDEVPVTEEITDQRIIEFGNVNVDNITFAYDDEIILKDFNLDINPNEITGIIGKSGSGKSTLLRLLMRFWDPNKGTISINERNLDKINTSNLRALESFVTQDTILFNKSINENIKVAKLDATQDDIIEAAKKASIHEFIQSLPEGYETVIGELGSTLSGGERQRIGLARAFLHDAPLMLLDEPTSNLDSLNEGIILKSIFDEKQNKTIVLVTHRKQTLSIADRIVKVESDRNS